MAKLNLKQIPTAIGIPCFDFKPDKFQREKRTVIIAPIRVEQVDVDTINIGWACSRGPHCQDSECRYSKASKRDNSSKRDNKFGYVAENRE